VKCRHHTIYELRRCHICQKKGLHNSVPPTANDSDLLSVFPDLLMTVDSAPDTSKFSGGGGESGGAGASADFSSDAGGVSGGGTD